MNAAFEWDKGNLQHVILDHPERGNTVDEVESLFQDPYFTTVFDRLDPNTQESRFGGVGMGTQGIVKHVVFVVRNGKIRPITCHKAKRKQQREYHEIVSQKRSITAGGNAGPEPGNSGGSQELAIPDGS